MFNVKFVRYFVLAFAVSMVFGVAGCKEEEDLSEKKAAEIVKKEVPPILVQCSKINGMGQELFGFIDNRNEVDASLSNVVKLQEKGLLTKGERFSGMLGTSQFFNFTNEGRRYVKPKEGSGGRSLEIMVAKPDLIKIISIIKSEPAFYRVRGTVSFVPASPFGEVLLKKGVSSEFTAEIVRHDDNRWEMTAIQEGDVS